MNGERLWVLNENRWMNGVVHGRANRWCAILPGHKINVSIYGCDATVAHICLWTHRSIFFGVYSDFRLKITLVLQVAYIYWVEKLYYWNCKFTFYIYISRLVYLLYYLQYMCVCSSSIKLCILSIAMGLLLRDLLSGAYGPSDRIALVVRQKVRCFLFLLLQTIHSFDFIGLQSIFYFYFL